MARPASPRSSAHGHLAVYRSKRDFSATTEPSGQKRLAAGARFVVQKHDATRLHYDFRLELDGVLKSWAVTRGPSLNPGDKRLAVRTEDHPIDYGDFEGTIPEGNYGAGTVLLWDRGTWEPVDDPHEGLERGKLTFRLHGEKLKGEWALVRMHSTGRGDRNRENWLLIKADDAKADRSRDVLEEEAKSVATGRDLPAIARGTTEWIGGRARTGGDASAKVRTLLKRRSPPRFPDFVNPALATLVDDVPNDEGWFFEVKFDGYRALVAADGDAVRVSTRNGLDWTDRFASIAAAVGRLNLDGVLLDGEVVVVDDEGRSDFGALQNTLDGEGGPLSFFVFDLLAEGHRSLTSLPLRERKARLKALLGTGRDGPVFYSDHTEADGAAMLKTLCAKGFEGIIAKRADSPYRSERGRDWLKIKCSHRQEFVVAGFSPSERGRHFASLLLGVRQGKALRYAGRVGSGFSQAMLDRLAQRFQPLIRKTQPFAEKLTGPIARTAVWLEPELVAEVAFAGFTRDNQVRQGRFLGLREDKPAEEVGIEEPKPMKTLAKAKEPATAAKPAKAAQTATPHVRLTHPQKLLYPIEGLTKEDVAVYLEAVAPFMLPFVERRLVSFVRCPDGRQKYCFFQRHPSPHMPGVFHAFPVKEKDGGSEDYLFLDGIEGIVTCAQIGALEIHGWGSRIDDIERPDRLVFDFDPAEDVPFAAVKAGALKMRDALDAVGLESFALLTGGKGMHVVVPLEPDRTWPAVKAFARALAEHFVEHEPERYVATMSKAKRGGKIFIDYFRNERGSTAVLPFSPRARPGAPVAWPVEWDDLADIESSSFVTIASFTGHDPGQAWPRSAGVRQTIGDAALRALKVDAEG